MKAVISNKNIKIYPDILHGKKPDYEETEKAFIESFKKLCKIWFCNREHVKNISINYSEKNGKNSPKSAVKDIMEIDRYCLSEYSIPPDILEKKYRSSRIVENTKTGHPPENPFFDQCENHIALWKNLENIYNKTVLWLKTEFVSFIDKQLESEKNRRSQKIFDDLLNRVCTLTNTETFAKAISDRYKAAIIDEFQDTDETQWSIFKNIFKKNSKPLFLIGDPKQAIYGFRGADIFSYLSAAKSADNIKFTLLENWRSEPGLVSAVNALFSPHKNPFINKDIRFIPARPAKSTIDLNKRCLFGDETKPFVLWFIDNSEDESGKKINKSDTEDIILEQMGNEMIRLLNMGKEGRVTIDGNPLKESHITVLIRSHSEAQRILDFLEKIKVKGVIYGTKSVFDSREATELEFILNAVARPDNIHTLTAAMGTELLGVPGERLKDFDKNLSFLGEKLKTFFEYREQWINHGFISMFNNLVCKEEIITRLAGLNQAERRLTNLRHLMELLNNAETEEQLNMDGLISWLSDRREKTPDNDSEQLRLESDENAVLIMTMHKSKGLEFPIVFIPFPWSCRTSAKESSYVLFHKGDSFYIDTGSEKIKENSMISKDEALAENIRLLYVALTRAKNRCYTAWGKIGKIPSVSAPAWLLHNKNYDYEKEEIGLSEATEKILKELTPKEILEELKNFEKDSGPTILESHAKQKKTQILGKSDNTATHLSSRSLNKQIDTNWCISSFSSLSKKSDFSENNIQDYDIFSEEKTEDTESRVKVVKSIFSMPKGAVTGNIFHEIFESYDFMETNENMLTDLIEKKCERYGYGNEWNSVIATTIRKVISAPLCAEVSDMTLSKIGKKDRLSELSFYSPIKELNIETLKRALAEDETLPAALKNNIAKLSFFSVKGFMKGYIDLIFRIYGKYYIVDWKSNHLGNTPEDYNQDAIMAVMAKEQYFLQYYIYTAALDKYLSLRIKNYDYRTCFGGVFYIFLRGAGHNTSLPGHGIFYNKPSYEAIKTFNLYF